jgi:PHD/YefM family antitoxin component YafN of YafNO toxin-antitoxin module
MAKATAIHPQFVVDSTGRQTAVLISIEEYNSLLEDLDDLATMTERLSEKTISHDQVVKELKADGYLPD